MNARNTPGQGWFEMEGVEGSDTGDSDTAAAATAIREGRGDQPREWPQLAVERGFVNDEATYYKRLHEATLAAARQAVAEREGADDQQLVHAVRALDDIGRKLT